MSPVCNQSDVLIRPLTSRDLPKVRDLHSKLLPVQYPTSFFLQLLLVPTRACFVAYKMAHPTVPIGFISAAIQQPVSTVRCFSSADVSTRALRDKTTLDPSRPRLEILTLGVLPSCQHRGLARRLIQRVADVLRESCASNSVDGIPICANVATNNTEAIEFYKHIGLDVSTNVIRNLYRALSYGSKDAYLVVGV
ncbi:acyl-CoA N-acyltransferase, partial [Pholiota conissans]